MICIVGLIACYVSSEKWDKAKIMMNDDGKYFSHVVNAMEKEYTSLGEIWTGFSLSLHGSV